MFWILSIGSVTDERDLTTRATIRNAALSLFAERGHDAVTVREIAFAAVVSLALVLHHFGSKDGLRVAVDSHAAESLGEIFAEFGGPELTEMLARGEATGSVAGAFVQDVHPGSPLSAYLCRLVLTNDPAGAALFGRWYATTRGVMDAMVESGIAAPTEDPAVRADP